MAPFTARRLRLLAAALLALAGGAAAQEPIQVQPPPVVPSYLPFPTLPALTLDEANNGIGVAQSLTRARKLQGRLLWIDATANLDRINTADKIAALVGKIRDAGFNTVVLDVKPIIGETIYPSKFAPKLTEWVRPWKTSTLPRDFDPLRELAGRAKGAGLSLMVNLSAFSEGHREFPGRGLAVQHPDWQTVLYEVEVRVRPVGADDMGWPVTDRPNLAPRQADDLTIWTDPDRLPKLSAGSLVAVLDAGGAVTALVDGPAYKTLGVALPRGGAALVAQSEASATFLRGRATPGTMLERTVRPIYVPAGERPERQVPLMTSPHNPEVRRHLLDMVTELASGYPIDGVVFDDRLRYAALNADFSEPARRAFETWLGKPVTWPDDVFRSEPTWPTLTRRDIPGPYYDSWLVFRALTMRNFVAEVGRVLRATRPGTLLGTYVGSWYPDYADLGANWAADDLPAGYRFLNDSYRKTGWAGIVDFVITGCYYATATLRDAAERGIGIGDTVEAAGQFSNRAVNDQAIVYAGVSLEKFKGKPEELKRVLQAAAATTQGIMCFDLSHDMDSFWSLFADAFQTPAAAPHATPGLLAEIRAEKARRKAAGIPDPPVIQYRGTAGTGF